MRRLALLFLLVGGCSDSASTGEVDCGADTPAVTWETFGQGFTATYCQGCHASTAADRYGAPEGVTFDTVKEVWFWKDRILSRSVGDDSSMPPAGGVSEDDRTKLEWWLVCAEEGT